MKVLPHVTHKGFGQWITKQSFLPLSPVSYTHLDVYKRQDEDNPEEIAVSYSVRAAELIPWTDSFQEGYWKALIEIGRAHV